MTDGASSSGTAGTTDADPDTSTGSTPTTGAVSATTWDSSTAPTTSDGGSSESGGETTPADDTSGTTGADGTSGETSDGTTGMDTPDGLSFAVDVYPIFDANCSCHEDDNGAGKLRLRFDDAYINLVDKPSEQLPEMMLVAPGATKLSYLWHKLNNTQKAVGGSGKKMPSGGLLAMEELAVIQTWIDEGAKP